MFQRSRRLIGAVGLDCYYYVKSEKLPKLGATLWTSPVARDAKSSNISTYWTLLGFLGASSVLFYWNRRNLWPSINLEARYKEFPALKFGKSNELRPGEWVMALGSSLSLKNTITLGIVSTVSCNEMGYEGGADMEYQTDAPITTENFGDPSQITEEDISSAQSTGPGEKPKRYRIGVIMMSISPPLLDSIWCKVHDIPMAVQSGVLLDEVHPNSPASDAGLQANDIIVKINGKQITSSNEVDDMVQKGTPFTVEVVRGRKKLKIVITPEALI